MLSFLSNCWGESVLHEVNCKLAYLELIIVDNLADLGRTLQFFLVETNFFLDLPDIILGPH